MRYSKGMGHFALAGRFLLLALTFTGFTAAQETASLKVLWVKENSEVLLRSGKRKLEGGVSDFKLTISKSSSESPQVAFLESKYEAAGAAWKTAGWIASFVASSEANCDLKSHEFLYRMGADRIDGPSAGMLFAAASLAMLKGTPLPQDRLAITSITGSINPDGTIGAISGLKYKIKAAVDANVIRIGYPVGCRVIWDEESEGLIDLQEYFESITRKLLANNQTGLKPELREISDISDAYHFLTGQELKTAYDADKALSYVPDISHSIVNRIRGAVVRLQKEYDDEKKQCRDLFKELKLRNDLNADLDSASSRISLAKAAEREGLPLTAYDDSLRALATMRLLKDSAELRKHYPGYDGEKLGITMNGLWLCLIKTLDVFNETNREMEGLRLALRGFEGGSSVSALVDRSNYQILYCEAESWMSAGYESLIQAFRTLLPYSNYVLQAKADNKLAKIENQSWGKAIADAVFSHVSDACLYFAIAETRSSAVSDMVGFSRRQDGSTVTVDMDEFFRPRAQGYAAAADAALSYFDELVVRQYAPSASVTDANRATNSASAKVTGTYSLHYLKQPDYQPILRAAQMSDQGSYEDLTELNKQFGLEIPRFEAKSPELTFGYGAYAYVGIANLLLKHYNLEFTLDSKQGLKKLDDGFLGVDLSSVGELNLRNRRALSRYLDLSRSKALAKAGHIQKSLDNNLPDSVAMNLNLGEAKRYGSDEEKLQAFSAFWRVSLLCDIAVNLLDKKDPKDAAPQDKEAGN